MSFKTNSNKQHLSEEEIAQILVELRDKPPVDNIPIRSAHPDTPNLRTRLFGHLLSRSRFKPEDIYLKYNSISDVMIWTDLDCLITYATQSVKALLGYPSEALMHRTLLALVNPDDSERMQRLISGHTDTGTLQVKMIAQDMNLVPVDARYDAIFDDREQITGYCITLRKILFTPDSAGSYNGIKRIMEDMPVALFAYNDDNFLFFNKMLTVITGYYPDDLEKMKIWQLFHSEDCQGIRDIQKNLPENAYESTSCEARIIHRDGSIRICALNAKRQRFSFGSSVVVSIHPILQKKEIAKETLSTNEQGIKPDLLAVMSSEMRAPMNSVTGLTSLLLNTDLTTEQRNFVGTLQENADQLLSILNETMDFTYMETGTIALKETTFKLSDCLAKALDSFSLRAKNKNIDLVYLIQPGVSQYLSGDTGRLQQVLESLVSQAIRHTKKGQISISVERISARNNNENLRFVIHYPGIGISEVHFNDLLEISQHNDQPHPGGYGLGLVVSRRIIQLMGGELRIENTPEQGAGFCFTAVLKSSHKSRTKRVIQDKADYLVNKRVLIADDNPTNQLILKLQFELWGMIPVFAESDEQAIDILKSDPAFDLVLVDMQMPGIGGTELVKNIKTLDQYAHIPMIILSTIGQHNSAGDMTGTQLLKPLKLNQLFENILEVMLKEQGIHFPAPAVDVKLAEHIPLNILVVEDNLLNQKLVVLLLARMGYKSKVADNGLIAYNLAKREAFDIIFMDVQMPEMDGIEATQAILQDNFNAKAPRIVAITANVMQGDREKCLQSGMVDYLAKPVKIHEIQQIIERWG